MAEIPATPADGNVAVWVAPAVAATGAPKLTEVSAGAVVDISCYLTADGYNETLDEQVIADERLCSTETYEQPGRSQRTLSVTYIDNTNSENEATDNKAKDTLVPGSVHYLIVRRGVAFDEPAAVGQKVTVLTVKAGQYSNLPPEANSVLKTTQKLFITGKTQVDVPLVA
ncbi:phage tail tube protein [Glutamicibacter soli]|uniref:phage tail tube protein n=1 Tax=Glutamicibacter soli TaxID=453836 RepID=UPI003FD00B1B